MSFFCRTCGKEHDRWPPDQAAKRPDEVWALSAEDRMARVKEDDDLCILDGTRFFIRAVLEIPQLERPDPWGLGLWVEISKQSFLRYLKLYDADASNEPSFDGMIANHLGFFPDALGTKVQIALGPASERPKLHCSIDDIGQLAKSQREGLDDQAIHAALA